MRRGWRRLSGCAISNRLTPWVAPSFSEDITGRSRNHRGTEYFVCCHGAARLAGVIYIRSPARTERGGGEGGSAMGACTRGLTRGIERTKSPKCDTRVIVSRTIAPDRSPDRSHGEWSLSLSLSHEQPSENSDVHKFLLTATGLLAWRSPDSRSATRTAACKKPRLPIAAAWTNDSTRRTTPQDDSSLVGDAHTGDI